MQAVQRGALSASQHPAPRHGAAMFSGHIHIRAGSGLTLTFDLWEAQAFCRCCYCLSHHFLSAFLLIPPPPVSVEADWLQHLCRGQRSWPWLVFVHLLQKVQVSVWSLVALCPRQQGEEVGGGGGIINFDVYICK